MKTKPELNPYSNLPELTIRGVILGALITVVFTASNVYLGLKVGLTFASSIPAAVISMAVLKFLGKGNILENNMVQTQASSAGTLSAIIFILPGLLMLGYWQAFSFWQTAVICAAGGILGVIFTIPLRKVMVVNSPLPYPEGVAAAEILKAGDISSSDGKGGETGIKEIVIGGGLAGAFSFLINGFRVVADSANYFFKIGSGIFQIPMGFSLALLGAGYLVGIAGGLAILLGTIFSWWVAVPYFTSGIATHGGHLSSIAMQVWVTKVRYIGVGMIGIAAIWTLISLFKPMVEGMRQSIKAFRHPELHASSHRTERDLSVGAMIWIVLGVFIVLFFAFYHFVDAVDIPTGVAWLLVVLCVIMSLIIGFLVAAACGYMAGLVGSSSSPISGIGIISIVLISLVLLIVGNNFDLLSNHSGQQFLTALAIFTTSVVIATATISNDNLQDLKTGYLVKATPWRQQVALIIGCIVGAVVIAPVLELLYNAYGFAGALPHAGMDPTQALAAPQATLMTTIAKGIFSHNLEWSYIFVGVALGAVLIAIDMLLRGRSAGKYSLPALAVGMGIYLPPSVNMPLVAGAIFSWWIRRIIRHYSQKNKLNEAELQEKANRKGTLFAAGLIVGESLVGVILAIVIALSVTSGGSESPFAIPLNNWDLPSEILGWAGFIFGMFIFGRRIIKAVK